MGSWRLAAGIVCASCCLSAEPANSDWLAEGGQRYRAGDFEGARAIYAKAADAPGGKPSALLGLALAEQALFLPRRAGLHLAEAFQAAPNAPIVLREYAASAADPNQETALLIRLIRQPETPQAWLEEASNRLELLRGLKARATHQLLSPYEPYQLRLPLAYSLDGRPLGWLLSLHVNGSRPLRIMLDTGARGLLLSEPAASRLGLERLAAARLGGFGDGGRRRGEFRLATSVELDGIRWGNVIVEVAHGPLFDAGNRLDGIVGVDLFRQFQITLNGPGQMLELEPYEATDARDGEGFRPWSSGEASETRVRKAASLHRLGHLLLAPAVLEDGTSGNVVLDSGAMHSVVHTQEPRLTFEAIPLVGVSGLTSARRLIHPVHIEIAGHPATLRDAVMKDLSAMAEDVGTRIDAVAGFPVLSRVVTELDLRSGELAISDRRQLRPRALRH